MGAVGVSVAVGDGDGDADGDADVCPVDRLQESLDAAVELALAPGGTLAVDQTGGCVWEGASGLADVDGEVPVHVGDMMRIGSITKGFTAAVILQLVEEGMLALDTTIDAFWPDFPNADRIQIRHLLSHTSGVFNYSEDPSIFGEEFGDPEGPWGNPTVHEHLVEVAAGHEPYGEPGTVYHYSNTNFIMLGLITEQVTGSTWAVEVRARLLDPLGLTHTFVEGDEAVDGLIRGYRYEQQTHVDPETGETTRDTVLVDDTDSMDPTWAWSAGVIVSTASDLTKWARALYAGDAVSDEMRAEMLTPVVLPDGTETHYGFAVIVNETEDGPYYWHNGLVNGFNGEVGLYADLDLALASLVNMYDSPGGSHSAVGNASYEMIVGED